MKRILKIIVTVVLCLIFIPLFIALLFLKPTEFLISSWHLSKATAVTEAVVIESEITRGSKSGTGSKLEYVYTIDGTEYTNSRIQAGLMSDGSFQNSGDTFAKEHPKGSTLQIFYDPNSPSFSLISWGWPKWSIGFSAGVWGMLTCYWVKEFSGKRRRKDILLSLTKALTFIGFITIFFFPITLGLPEIRHISILYALSSFIIFFYQLFIGAKKST